MSPAAKACAYLAEGRVIVTGVSVGYCTATVRGTGVLHRVTFTAGEWSCSCPSRSTSCAHLRAVRLVVAVDLDVS